MQRYHFDDSGTYLGYLDREGHYRDPGGGDSGFVIRDGGFYDTCGRYRGYVDIVGRYYDEGGAYRGYFRAAFQPSLTRPSTKHHFAPKRTKNTKP